MDSERRANLSVTQTYLPILPATKFTTLRKGGFVNGKQVDGYVFQAGKVWNTDTGAGKANWLKATFHQDAPPPAAGKQR